MPRLTSIWELTTWALLPNHVESGTRPLLLPDIPVGMEESAIISASSNYQAQLVSTVTKSYSN